MAANESGRGLADSNLAIVGFNPDDEAVAGINEGRRRTEGRLEGYTDGLPLDGTYQHNESTRRIQTRGRRGSNER